MSAIVTEIAGREEVYCAWWRCPECQEAEIKDSFNFCPMCGVEIEIQPPEVAAPVDKSPADLGMKA